MSRDKSLSLPVRPAAITTLWNQDDLDVVASDGNGERILGSLKSGDYFGEGARPKIDCCIRARTRVRLLAIDTQVAEALSAVRPDAAMLLKQGKNGTAAGRTV